MRTITVIVASILGLVSVQGCDGFSEAVSFHGAGAIAHDAAPHMQDGDNYEGVGTHPFVLTEADPLSTFAVDVDTASYDIFRRDVQNFNMLPAPESVRVEEYINAFDYDLEKPEWGDQHPFSITLEAARSPFTHTSLLRVGLQGVEIPEAEKKPANIVFLVDVSGSMGSHDKLPLVKLVIREALENLSPTDTVSIVTYAGHESVALVPTHAAMKGKITEVVHNLEASGSTAGQKGLALAYDQAEVGLIEGGINHVIMCTDGDFNVGISNTNDLVDFIREKRETGVTFTALGFGMGNLNDHMMESVSNAGNGFYSVIMSEEHAIDYAANSLWNTANLIARDVKIQVQFNPEHVKAYRLLGYENRALSDDQFVNDRVDAGELGSGHRVTALYEVVLSGETIPQPENAPLPLTEESVLTDIPAIESMVEVRVRYKEVMASSDTPALEVTQSMSPSQLFGDFGQGSSDLQWVTGVAAFAEVLKESPFAVSGDLSVIEELLSMNIGEKVDRSEFLALFLKAKQLLSQTGSP